jgi:secreted trypsin-like serine protease
MPDDTTLRVMGFGASDNEGLLPGLLQQADHWVVPDEECEAITHLDFSFEGMISDDMTCASGGDGVGVCAGDSGGPLIQMGSLPSQDVQVGIVSW